MHKLRSATRSQLAALAVLVGLSLATSSASADASRAKIERGEGHYWVHFHIRHECPLGYEAKVQDECPWFDEVDVYSGSRLCPSESTAHGRIYIGRIWRFPTTDEEIERIPRLTTRRIIVCLYVDEGGASEEVGEYHFRLAHVPQ